MGLPLSTQVIELLFAALLGAIIGVTYDLFRSITLRFKRRINISIITDILFWVGVLIIILLVGLHFFKNGLRIYIFIGIACGFCLYFLTLSEYVLKILKFLVNFVLVILLGILKPLVRITGIILCKLTKMLKNIKKFVKKAFQKKDNAVE